jgi:hypothetical protein
MGRIRTIKPEFFRHEELFDLEQETKLPIRLAFAGLWTTCDREGRFKWRPRTLKAEVLPFDEVDFSRVLDALATRGFLVRYASEGEEYGCIPSWSKHQVINNRETASVIPSAPEHSSTEVLDASATREAREGHAGKAEGKGREGKGKEGKGKEGGDLSDRPKRATPLMDGFELDTDMILFANENGVDAEREFAAFRDHHKAKGTVFKDWVAAWRNWVRNAKKFDRAGSIAASRGGNRAEERDRNNLRAAGLIG